MNCAETLLKMGGVLALWMISACEPLNPLSDTRATAGRRDPFTQYQGGEKVQRGRALRFPRDHGSHLEQSIEWWYLTANLTATSGQTFGVQWTLFRARLPDRSAPSDAGPAASLADNPWWHGQLYFAHFALQTDHTHRAFERFGRAGQVRIQAAPFRVSLDDWSLVTAPSGGVEPRFLPLRLQASAEHEGAPYSVVLDLDDSPRVAHGDEGFSQKTPQGDASYYYSLPLLRASGTLRFAGQAYTVSGSAWLDHEWSGGLLNQRYIGWDWFSLQADDGTTAIMAFCVRGEEDKHRYCDASRITRGGEIQGVDRHDITLRVTETREFTNRRYPVKWQLALGKDQLIIEARNPDSRNQLTFSYWEGRVSVRSAPQSATVFTGKGYAELTGY